VSSRDHAGERAGFHIRFEINRLLLPMRAEGSPEPRLLLATSDGNNGSGLHTLRGEYIADFGFKRGSRVVF